MNQSFVTFARGSRATFTSTSPLALNSKISPSYVATINFFSLLFLLLLLLLLLFFVSSLFTYTAVLPCSLLSRNIGNRPFATGCPVSGSNSSIACTNVFTRTSLCPSLCTSTNRGVAYTEDETRWRHFKCTFDGQYPPTNFFFFVFFESSVSIPRPIFSLNEASGFAFRCKNILPSLLVLVLSEEYFIKTSSSCVICLISEAEDTNSRDEHITNNRLLILILNIIIIIFFCNVVYVEIRSSLK